MTTSDNLIARSHSDMRPTSLRRFCFGERDDELPNVRERLQIKVCAKTAMLRFRFIRGVSDSLRILWNKMGLSVLWLRLDRLENLQTATMVGGTC